MIRLRLLSTDRPLSVSTLNMHSHPWGDFAGLAQAVIHDTEIQVNPLLPGAMPQFPEGPRRNLHKHCDLTVICLHCEPSNSSWPVCMVCKWRFMGGRKAHCSVACRANMNCYGKEASRETDRREWGSGAGQETSSTEATCSGRKCWQGSAQISQDGQIIRVGGSLVRAGCELCVRQVGAGCEWCGSRVGLVEPSGSWIGSRSEPGGNLSTYFVSTRLDMQSHPGLLRVEQRHSGEEKKDGRKRKDGREEGKEGWSEVSPTGRGLGSTA